MVAPDGTITAATSEFTAASLVERVPLRDTTTLSDRLGAWIEYGLVSAALAGVLIGLVHGHRSGRGSADGTQVTGAE
jgi:apolipoprotein N-acyltransferase